MSSEHKLNADLAPVPGRVGHDRIQQGRASESIGESIRRWYALPSGDFERIDVDIEIREDVFYLAPLRYKYAASTRIARIAHIDRPLNFTRDYVSPLWRQQLGRLSGQEPAMVRWALDEICRVVQDHSAKGKLAYVLEPDLLRASGPLKHLGVALGGYVGKGYDCITSFQFLKYPAYSVPLEIKKYSTGFHYQERKYGKEELSRAVVLCAFHSHKHLPRHIDVIELTEMCRFGKEFGAVSTT